MKRLFQTLAIALALTTLAGCGLKGPLYFPPEDKTATPPVTDGTQDTTPVRNDRGRSDQPTQVIY